MNLLLFCVLLGLASGMSAARQLSPSSLRGLLSNAAAGRSAGHSAAKAKPKKVQQAILGELTTSAAGSGQWLNTKPTDACMPFDVGRYGHSNIDSFCAKLNSLSDAELRELHAQAPLPSATGGFPLRGCTHRCIAGNSFAALVAKMPENNIGWGGKCFDWNLNPQTGVPVELINVFSPNYDNSSMPDSERVKGVQQAHARVYYVDHSRADDKPAWRFDHDGAENIWDPVRKTMLIVQGFNDEMREVRPGFLLGRIFIKYRDDPVTTEEMPIVFGLIQACTADGQFPTTPEARAQPPLGSQQ